MSEHNHVFKDIGVKITRYFANDADEAGTLERIRAEIDEVRKGLEGFEPWNGLQIIIAREDAPEFSQTELDEYGAAGLTYGSKELIVIRYKDSYSIDQVIRILCHELGHWVASQSGMDTRTAFGRLAIEYFKSIMPIGQAQGDAWGEAFAECWASIMGTDEFRGQFSDGVKYYPPAAMTSFMKALYTTSMIADKNAVDRLWADINGLAWREKRIIQVRREWWHWWTEPVEVKLWQRVTLYLVHQVWVDGKWI